MSILIVEDEVLLAMDIEAMVEDCGHRVIGEANCLQEVAALPDEPSPHVAFVDVHLSHGSNGIDVSRLIRARWADAVIVFVTANPKEIPADFGDAHGVIPKPFSRRGLSSAMQYIEEGVFDPPPSGPSPSSFVAFPNLSTRFKLKS